MGSVPRDRRPPAGISLCDHKFVHLETLRSSDSDGYSIHYRRVDQFFCERCLEQKEIVKEEWSREKPDWY